MLFRFTCGGGNKGIHKQRRTGVIKPICKPPMHLYTIAKSITDNCHKGAQFQIILHPGSKDSAAFSSLSTLTRDLNDPKLTAKSSTWLYTGAQVEEQGIDRFKVFPTIYRRITFPHPRASSAVATSLAQE